VLFLLLSNVVMNLKVFLTTLIVTLTCSVKWLTVKEFGGSTSTIAFGGCGILVKQCLWTLMPFYHVT